MRREHLTSDVEVECYGDFWLTDAVRAAPDAEIVPREGYRLGIYRDRRVGLKIPVLSAAVSRERLFEVFLDMLVPLGEAVDLILETSHDSPDGSHRDLHREHIEVPVLQSYFCDYEDLLLNDGCTGVAVLSRRKRMEVQFDEHKMLVVYAKNLLPFEHVLKQRAIRHVEGLQLVSEVEHIHSTQPRHAGEFEQLCYLLGMGEAANHVNWW